MRKIDKISYLKGYLHAYQDLIHKPALKEALYLREDIPTWLMKELNGYIESTKKAIKILEKGENDERKNI